MSEQNEKTSTLRDKKIKPKIEAAISEYLNGDRKKNALEFISYLKANGMSPHWNSTNSWKACYRQKLVCFIKVYDSGSWQIRPALYNTSNPCVPCDFEKFIIEEKLEEFIWRNLKACRSCLPCAPGISIKIADKEFHNRCGYNTVQINNPDTEALLNIKKILEYKKSIILQQQRH